MIRNRKASQSLASCVTLALTNVKASDVHRKDALRKTSTYVINSIQLLVSVLGKTQLCIFLLFFLENTLCHYGSYNTSSSVTSFRKTKVITSVLKTVQRTRILQVVLFKCLYN